jgi:hypothetical protein
MKRPRKALVFLIDGFDPAYLQPGRMPRLARLMKGSHRSPALLHISPIGLLLFDN